MSAHVFGQPAPGFGPQVLGQQIELNGQRVGRLSGLRNAPVGCDEFAVEGFPDGLVQLPVVPGLVGFPDYFGRLRQQPRAVGKVGGCQKIAPGRRPRIGPPHILFGHECQPVAKVEARVPDQILPCFPAHVLDPGLHAGILHLQNTPVAIHLVHRPGNDHGGIGPAGRTARKPSRKGRQDVGHDMGYSSFRTLIGRYITQPLGKKAADQPVEHGRPGKHLGVARPSQPLVALRTVGGHVQEVALHAPLDVELKPVQQRVRADPCAGRLKGRVDHDAGNGLRCQLPRIAADGHVTEAVEGEMGLENFLAVPFKDVLVRLSGTAEVFRVEIAVFVQHLGVAERHDRAGRPPYAQSHPAHHVLAHIHHRIAFGRVQDRDRTDLLNATHGRTDGRDQDVFRVLQYTHAPPVAVVIARLGPAFFFKAGVRRSRPCRCPTCGWARSSPSSRGPRSRPACGRPRR